MNKIYVILLSSLIILSCINIVQATPLSDLMSDRATNLTLTISENQTLVNLYLDTSGYGWDSSQEVSFGGYSMTLPPSFVLDNINLREDFNKTTNKITFSEVYISPNISWLLDFVLSDYGITSQQINANNSILTNLVSQYAQNIVGNSYFKKQGRNYQIWYDHGWGSISESDRNNSKEYLNNVYIVNINKSIEDAVYSINPKEIINNYVLSFLNYDLTNYLNEINYSVDKINFTKDYTIEVGSNIILEDGSYLVNVKVKDNNNGEEVNKNIHVNLQGFPTCTENLVNTDWVNAGTCKINNFLTQSRILYDSNSCGAVNQTEYQEIACDFCTPNMLYTEFGSWINTETCQSNNLLTQSRSRTLFDNNNCGEISNSTEIEYQETSCDFCTPNLVYSEVSNWIDTESCQSNNLLTQSRFKTKYDSNSCNEIANETILEYQEIACDYCTPNMVNTSWSEWTNQGTCNSNNLQSQTRFLTTYDSNSCGEVENTTTTEERDVVCDFCTPNLVYSDFTDWNNLTCENNLMNQSRSRTLSDVNSCGDVEDEVFFEYRNTETCGEIPTNGTIENYTYSFSENSQNFQKIEGLLNGTNITIESRNISDFSIPSTIIGLEIMNISADQNTSGMIYFKINKSRVIEPLKISLYVLEDTWTKLTTTYLSSDNDYYYFKSYTPHFSTFMIGEEKVVPVVPSSGGSSGGSGGSHHSSSSIIGSSSETNSSSNQCIGSGCNIDNGEGTTIPTDLNKDKKGTPEEVYWVITIVLIIGIAGLIYAIKRRVKNKNESPFEEWEK